MKDLDLFEKHSQRISDHFCPGNSNLYKAILELVTDAYEMGMEEGRAPYVRTSLETQIKEIIKEEKKNKKWTSMFDGDCR